MSAESEHCQVWSKSLYPFHPPSHPPPTHKNPGHCLCRKKNTHCGNGLPFPWPSQPFCSLPAGSEVGGERERDRTDFQVDPIQQVLHGLGLRGSPFPPPPGWTLGLLLLLIEHVHVDELECAHFVVQQAHPSAHGRLADDINDVSFLRRNKEFR